MNKPDKLKRKIGGLTPFIHNMRSFLSYLAWQCLYIDYRSAEQTNQPERKCNNVRKRKENFRETFKDCP